jgi:hypothetical protein
MARDLALALAGPQVQASEEVRAALSLVGEGFGNLLATQALPDA